MDESKIMESEKKEALEIKKSEEHLAAIKAHLSKGLSPSALNSFLLCPLNYYYRYILGMREEQIIEEKIENNTFGTVIHDSLEALYTPFVGKILDAKSIEDKESTKADTEATLVNTKEEKGSKTKEAMATAQFLSETHGDCDWLLSNFDTRKEARAGEIDALTKAKAVLSGADYSLLQDPPWSLS